MKQIKMFNLKNAAEFLDYSLIFNPERIKTIIENLYSDQAFALGLNVDNKPVGFISVFKRGENKWQCDSPILLKGYQKKGFEKLLLNKLITEVKKKNADTLYFRYVEHPKKPGSFPDVFTDLGFKPSGYSRKVFIIQKSEIEKFKIMVDNRYARYLKMTGEKAIKRLCDLSHKEIDQLKTQKGIQYDEWFDPFLMEDIDSTLSRIIFIKGDPAAWVTYLVLGKSAMYVDRFFVKEPYRYYGLFFPLFYDTYINTPEEIKKLVLYINGKNQKMLRLFRIFNDCEKTEDTTIELMKELKKELI